jgi:murein tripeptide amidase MpaA
LFKNIPNLQNQYPNLIQSFDIGLSQSDNSPVKIFKMTNNNNNNNKKNLLFIGSVYAKDIVNANLLYNSFLDLLNSNNPELLNCLDNTAVWIIPTLNPDGYNFAFNQNNLSFLGILTITIINNTFNPDLDGVNLNANFPFNWIHGLDYNSGNQFFRGNSPLSEKNP